MGLWIVDRSIVRTVFTLAMAVVVAAAAVQARRDRRRARRFLEDHPDPVPER